MKVWMKYLIGMVIGVLAAILLPWNNITGSSIITFITELCIRFGRYLVVPLIFTTAIVSINKLRLSNLVLKTSIWTFAIIVISSLLLTVIGLVSVLIVKLPRIPITVDVTTEIASIDIKSLLLSLFPQSAFQTLENGTFLLVSFLFALMIGWTCYSDQNTFKPIYNLAYASSQLFYKLSSAFSEVLSILIIAIMCYWTISFRAAFATGIYTPMIALFVVDFVIIVGVIYPIVVRYVCREPHPYRVLYAAFAPMFIGFISGDENFSLPVAIRHGKDSLGIKRRSSGFTFPLFSIFARGGSALVAAISFVLIWRSYSSLKLPFEDIALIFSVCFGLSFLLGNLPTGGAFVLLTILCQTYGKGLKTSFLLLKPAMIIICSFSSLFNIATAFFGSYIVAAKTNMVEHHQLFRFI